MDFLKRWMRQINAQLSGLTSSQKMLIGSLLVVMFLVLFLVTQYAATPEMVPLLDQSLTPEEMTEVTSYLDSHDIGYELAIDRIRVPFDKRYDILARLQIQQLLPEDTSSGFTDIVEKATWWKSSEQSRTELNIAKQNVLAGVVKKMKGVEDATVIISMPRRVGFDATHKFPTASVSVSMKGGSMSQKIADAIAGLVSGSVAEMRPEHVDIVNTSDGRVWRVRNDEDMTATTYLETKMALERALIEKIEKVLIIPGMLVEVSVQPDITRRHIEETVVDPKKSAELLTSEFEKVMDSTEYEIGGEPGARPNTGGTIAGASGPQIQSKSTTEERENRYSPYPGTLYEKKLNAGGAPLLVSATINLPRSYFENVYRQQNANDAIEAPTDQDLQLDVEKTRITNIIQPLLQFVTLNHRLPDEQLVAKEGSLIVGHYYEIPPKIDTANAGIGDDSSWQSTLTLFALAIASLLFMVMIFRKAGEREPMPDVRELAGVPPDEVIEASIEAEVEAQFDEQDVRSRKLAEQVSEMVRQQPGEAAELLRRWAHHEY